MIVSQVSIATGRFAGRAALLTLLVAAIAILGSLFSLSGCSQNRDEVVLAEVGDRPITIGYYEKMLAKMSPTDLPMGEDNLPADTATLAGKEAFLDVIINKELMALKAFDLKYEEEASIAGAAQTMLDYNAGTVFQSDLSDIPASEISDAELQHYYEMIPAVRNCSFIVCNFEDDATKARKAVLSGSEWEEVAGEYHDGEQTQAGDYTVRLTYGRWEPDFEDAIWKLQEGEVSEPITSSYGFWVVRLDSITTQEIPPLPEIRDRLVDSIRMRKMGSERKIYAEEFRQKYEYSMDPEALWIIFDALPTGEMVLDPQTNEPVPRSELEALEISDSEADRVFYQYRGPDGEMVVVTVGDYKEKFDHMNTFQRPKRSEMLGGLRVKILQEVDKQLNTQEAAARGYYTDPRVKETVDLKVEEMMVSKMHGDLVVYSEEILPEDLQEFWAEVADQYIVPEGRDGLIVLCATEADAQKAQAAALAGTDWTTILADYGTDPQNKANQGQLQMMRDNITHPIKEQLFVLAVKGDVSPPFPLGEGWAVLRLGNTEGSRARELDEVQAEIEKRILLRRQDQALRELLTEWRQQFGVVVYEDKLNQVYSWEELTSEPVS